MSKAKPRLTARVGVSASPKERTTLRVNSNVVEALEDVLKANPAFGFDSATQAATQAIVEFTERLRYRAARARGETVVLPPELGTELASFLRDAAKPSKPAESKKKA